MSAASATAIAIEGGSRFLGPLRVPGDKSISHRALVVGALAEGISEVRGRSEGDDVRHTEAAVRALGAHVDGTAIRGGRGLLRAPDGPLDFGNSATGMRLMAGVVASWPWTVALTGDESLSQRPMDRVAVPLRIMGAEVSGRTERCLPPLQVHGGSLQGIDYAPPMASAQVKSCVLLAGLRANGPTTVREAVGTREHTEELLARCGAQITVSAQDAVRVVHLVPGTLEPFELEVPGDPSQAAFWIVGASLVPGSEITVERVYTGPARRGFLDVLARMGARIEEVPVTTSADLAATADLVARSAHLVATEVEAAEIPSLDEVPVLAVAAAHAEGTTVFHDVAELRVKESDRLTGVVELVRAFGAFAETQGDDLFVTGAPVLQAGNVDARGDHRMAMAAAIAAACVPPGRPSRVLGWQGVQTSYPGFRSQLADLTGAGA